MNFFSRIKRIILIARCLWRGVFWGRASQRPKSVSRIIVVPTGKLGDIVCNTPVLKAIRTYLPKAHLIVAGATKLHRPILSDSGLVDEYLDLEKKGMIDRAKNYQADVAIVTGPSYEPAALLYLAGVPLVIAARVEGGVSPAVTRPYKILQRLIKTFPYRFGEYAPRERLRALEPLGIFSDDTRKHLGFSQIADQKVEQFFFANNLNSENDLIVGISPTAGNKIKEWPTERFAKVADYLYEKYNAKVLIVGSKNDSAKAQEMISHLNKNTKLIDATGAFNLDELKAFISKLQLFISVDTGPIYIAEAFGVPTVNIVGPVDERVQPPRGLIHRNVVPPNRQRAELSILNARSYNQEEARRQVFSITVPAVIEEIDRLISDGQVHKTVV